MIEEELFKRGIPVDAFKTSTRQAKTDLINVLQNAFDDGREQIGEFTDKDEAGASVRIPIMEPPGEGNWGVLRLPLITQLMDELGIYAFDDKDLVQDSVIALALAADLAYESEAIREPLLGGIYAARR